MYVSTASHAYCHYDVVLHAQYHFKKNLRALYRDVYRRTCYLELARSLKRTINNAKLFSQQQNYEHRIENRKFQKYASRESIVIGVQWKHLSNFIHLVGAK